MIKWKIEAFAPTLMKAEGFTGKEGIFLSVSNSSIQNGSVYLFKEGIVEQLRIMKCERLQVSIESFSSLMSPIKKISLKPIDSSIIKDDLVERRVEKNFRMSTLGSPHILNKQRNVDIKCLDRNITSCIAAIKFSNEDNLTNDSTAASIYHTPSSMKGNDISEVEVVSKQLDNLSILDNNDKISIVTDSLEADCSIVDTSFENFLTSTPLKVTSNDCNNSSKRSRKKKKGSKNLHSDVSESMLSTSCKDSSTSYFRIDANTEISIENVNLPHLKGFEWDVVDYYCENSYESLKKIVKRKLIVSQSDSPICVNGLVLSGLPGTGEKHAVMYLCTELEITLVTLSINEWAKSGLTESQFVDETIKKARRGAPSIILLEEIDTLCPPQSNNNRNDDELSSQIIRIFNKSKTWSEQILLVATCFNLPPVQLMQPGKLNKEIIFALPTPEERAQILCRLLESVPHSLTSEDIRILSKEALGFSGADLTCALKGAWFQCIQRSKNGKTELKEVSLSMEDYLEAIQNVVPPFMRHKLSSVSKVEWSDVFGYSNIKSKLKLLIDRHICDPVENPLKGFLFFGPPGCSKTMLVQALVKETNFSFFPLKCSDLLSKYVGETEKRLSHIFSIALKAAPSLIFMDEIDSLCQERSKGSGGSGLLSELLVWMEQTSKKNIMVIGATNRPEVLDEALFSPVV